ncbi:flavin reductase family protein [Streptomyces sp. TRM70308]|uniref:flavin reductase family protein n=1 Tax=Streptomyces sp. TRM70308 TaxID=3131932 RepID=UPI003D04D094
MSAARSSARVAGARTGSPELLRAAFRRHPAGVAVITAVHPGDDPGRPRAPEGARADGAGSGPDRPVGFTATSLTSVAAEPPLLSFGIGTGSSSWPAVARSGHVGVHLLGAHQRELAETFARSGADRFAPPVRWRPGPHGVPVLADVPVWLVCRVLSRVAAGDHRVVIAEVVAGATDGPGRPLLYHRGRFTALGGEAVPPPGLDPPG